MIFLKPNTAIIGPNVPIQLPADAHPVHHEGELVAVIERPCKDAPAAKAADYILGYTIANDVSARSAEEGRPVMRAKGHDTFCPVARGSRPPSTRPAGPAHRSQRAGAVRTATLRCCCTTSWGDRGMGVGRDDAVARSDLILTGTPRGCRPHRGRRHCGASLSRASHLTNPVVRKGK